MKREHRIILSDKFAIDNGWKRTAAAFNMSTLERAGAHDGGAWISDYPDHAEFFKKDRRAIAIVGHNYDGQSPPHYGTENIVNPALNLEVHVAPAGKSASWYCPGGTTLLVIVRPGTKIVWPTIEEMDVFAALQSDHERELREKRIV